MVDETILLTLWLALVIISYIVAVYFLILQQKEDTDAKRRILFLVFCLFLFMGLSRMFHLLSYINNNEPTLFAINQLFIISGLIVIIFSFEKNIARGSKNILTIALVATEVFYFVFNVIIINIALISDISQLVLAFTMLVAGVSILLLYLKMYFQATGEMKKKSLLIIIGILFMILSYGVFILIGPIEESLISLISFICTMISIPFLLLGYK